MGENPPHSVSTADRTPRPLTRRRLLKLGLGFLGALAVAGSAVRWLFWDRLQTRYLAAAYPVLDAAAAGRLDAATMRVLEQTVETLLGIAVPARYQGYFEWHAGEVRGYLALYKSFASYMNARSRRVHGVAYSDCTMDQRQAILSPILDARAHHQVGTRLSRIWRGLRHRRLVQYDTYILREILDLYARTEAWLAVGYDAYPGAAAGLDSYRRPLPTA